MAAIEQTSKSIIRSFFILFLLTVLFSSCKKDPVLGDSSMELPIPRGFPYPEVPEDNLPTHYRIELGKKLFNDPILSRDSSIACSSCHLEGLKFTDSLAYSKGINNQNTARNSMSLLNVAYQPSMFWDGGVPTLEQQVLAPISNPLEMDFDVNQVVERLLQHPEYPALFEQAYGKSPSVYTLTRAIANFERTLYTGFSRYDDYVYNKNESALNESEKRGMEVFFKERGECFHCHGGYNFTDYSFQNNGIFEVYADSGRAIITGKPADIGKFKVPSLRNIALTGPYMHNGSMKTLEEVVEHYSTGGKNHPNKSGLIIPLNLTIQEKADLVNFLRALSD